MSLEKKFLYQPIISNIKQPDTSITSLKKWQRQREKLRDEFKTCLQESIDILNNALKDDIQAPFRHLLKEFLNKKTRLEILHAEFEKQLASITTSGPIDPHKLANAIDDYEALLPGWKNFHETPWEERIDMSRYSTLETPYSVFHLPEDYEIRLERTTSYLKTIKQKFTKNILELSDSEEEAQKKWANAICDNVYQQLRSIYHQAFIEVVTKIKKDAENKKLTFKNEWGTQPHCGVPLLCDELSKLTGKERDLKDIQVYIEQFDSLTDWRATAEVKEYVRELTDIYNAYKKDVASIPETAKDYLPEEVKDVLYNRRKFVEPEKHNEAKAPPQNVDKSEAASSQPNLNSPNTSPSPTEQLPEPKPIGNKELPPKIPQPEQQQPITPPSPPPPNEVKDALTRLGLNCNDANYSTVANILANMGSVKKAYYKVAQKFHTDTAGEENKEKFQEIQNTYEFLVRWAEYQSLPTKIASALSEAVKTINFSQCRSNPLLGFNETINGYLDTIFLNESFYPQLAKLVSSRNASMEWQGIINWFSQFILTEMQENWAVFNHIYQLVEARLCYIFFLQFRAAIQPDQQTLQFKIAVHAAVFSTYFNARCFGNDSNFQAVALLEHLDEGEVISITNEQFQRIIDNPTLNSTKIAYINQTITHLSNSNNSVSFAKAVQCFRSYLQLFTDTLSTDEQQIRQFLLTNRDALLQLQQIHQASCSNLNLCQHLVQIFLALNLPTDRLEHAQLALANAENQYRKSYASLLSVQRDYLLEVERQRQAMEQEQKRQQEIIKQREEQLKQERLRAEASKQEQQKRKIEQEREKEEKNKAKLDHFRNQLISLSGKEGLTVVEGRIVFNNIIELAEFLDTVFKKSELYPLLQQTLDDSTGFGTELRDLLVAHITLISDCYMSAKDIKSFIEDKINTIFLAKCDQNFLSQSEVTVFKTYFANPLGLHSSSLTQVEIPYKFVWLENAEKKIEEEIKPLFTVRIQQYAFLALDEVHDYHSKNDQDSLQKAFSYFIAYLILGDHHEWMATITPERFKEFLSSKELNDLAQTAKPSYVSRDRIISKLDQLIENKLKGKPETKKEVERKPLEQRTKKGAAASKPKGKLPPWSSVRKAEERKQLEEQKKHEEELKQLEAQQKQEEEEKQKQLEIQQKQEEERKRLEAQQKQEEEQRQKQLEIQQKQEEERKQLEAQQKQEEEEKQKQLEIQQKQEKEQKRLEAQQKQEEEERKQLEAQRKQLKKTKKVHKVVQKQNRAIAIDQKLLSGLENYTSLGIQILRFFARIAWGITYVLTLGSRPAFDRFLDKQNLAAQLIDELNSKNINHEAFEADLENACVIKNEEQDSNTLHAYDHIFTKEAKELMRSGELHSIIHEAINSQNKPQ